MRIYTKTGDKGSTSLANGERVSKSSLRIETYGTADELNAYFGWLQSRVAAVDGGETYAAQLSTIQNKLFNLGALLSRASGEWLCEGDVKELEQWIDATQETLPAQHSFLLPAGSETIALAHVCRTVTRRLERQMIALQEAEADADIRVPIKWINRLSDFCFVFARKCSILQKKQEVEWKK